MQTIDPKEAVKLFKRIMEIKIHLSSITEELDKEGYLPDRISEISFHHAPEKNEDFELWYQIDAMQRITEMLENIDSRINESLNDMDHIFYLLDFKQKENKWVVPEELLSY